MNQEKNIISRRDFLHTAAVGAAVLATGSMVNILAKEEPATSTAMKIFVCSVCGHVEFGVAPETCPVCHAPTDKFTPNNTLFSDAMTKFKDVSASHSPVIILKKEPPLVSDIPCKEISVRVGKTMHPMEETHHIKFIDWYMNDKFLNRSFIPLQIYPAASIYVKPAGAKVRTISFCNLHGYWQAETAL